MDLDVAHLTRLQTVAGPEETRRELCSLAWGLGACSHEPASLGCWHLWPLLTLPCPRVECPWGPGHSRGSQDRGAEPEQRSCCSPVSLLQLGRGPPGGAARERLPCCSLNRSRWTCLSFLAPRWLLGSNWVMAAFLRLAGGWGPGSRSLGATATWRGAEPGSPCGLAVAALLSSVPGK